MTDANDNSPVCLRLPRLQLDRRSDVGTRVGVLRVTDADIGANAEILYEEVRGQFAPQYLEVDAQTGEILTIK